MLTNEDRMNTYAYGYTCQYVRFLPPPEEKNTIPFQIRVQSYFPLAAQGHSLINLYLNAKHTERQNSDESSGVIIRYIPQEP